MLQVTTLYQLFERKALYIRLPDGVNVRQHLQSNTQIN